MLLTFSELKSYRITVAGFDVGQFADVIFPRGQWTVRYIVVWSDLLNREIALPASHVVQVDRDKRTFQIDAQPDLVETSPHLDLTRRVERHEEQQLYEHYGWPPDWLQDEHDVTPVGPLSDESEQLDISERVEAGSPELQVVSRCIGDFTVHANEEELGVLDEVVIDDLRWNIPFLAIDTPLRESSVLVETGRVSRVDWISKDIYVSLPAATLIEGPKYDPNESLTPELAGRLRQFYERIGEPA